MPRIDAPRRTKCAGCNQVCRVDGQQIQWYESSGQYPQWLWTKRTLCPPCRTAQRDFWFTPARDKQPVVQLRLLSDVEAPIGVDELLDFRRGRPGYRKWLASPWNAASS